jgi:hypothetical protein
MRQPEQVNSQLRTRFDREYPDWARGRGTWPMRIPLQPPTTAERSRDPLGCHNWAARWRDYTGPGTIEHANARFPTGSHPMPKTLVINRPADVAAVDPATQAIWQRCGQRLTSLQRQFPQARFDRIIRRLTDLDELTYQQLTATVVWLHTHPTSGLLLRQLPIEGIGTKWLAQHAALVLALLGDPDFPIDRASEDEIPASARIRLHERLGLRIVPDLVQVTVLDPGLRAQVGGMRHFAASVEDLNGWQKSPRVVVILENKETGYAITDDHLGVVVLHGHGFSVVNYGRITWVRHAKDVIYWGDLDLSGLQFLSDLRGLGIPARTILTDMATLNRYRHLAIYGASPQRAAASHLTRDEEDLYASLAEYAAASDAGLLLEQERIPWPVAYPVLTRAMDPDLWEEEREPFGCPDR